MELDRDLRSCGVFSDDESLILGTFRGCDDRKRSLMKCLPFFLSLR